MWLSKTQCRHDKSIGEERRTEFHVLKYTLNVVALYFASPLSLTKRCFSEQLTLKSWKIRIQQFDCIFFSYFSFSLSHIHRDLQRRGNYLFFPFTAACGIWQKCYHTRLESGWSSNPEAFSMILMKDCKGRCLRLKGNSAHTCGY